MHELVSILRACHMMVSSRYHGIVTSMPGLVPSAGITMDERIRNLMRERGHQDLLMNVDDPDLEPKLLAALEKLATQGEAIVGRNRTDRCEKFESHGAHGCVLRGRSAAAVSRVSHPQGRMELGRLSAADEYGVEAVDRSVRLEGSRRREVLVRTGERAR